MKPYSSYPSTRGSNYRAVTEITVMTIFLLTLNCVLPSLAMAQTDWKDRYVTIFTSDQVNPTIARPDKIDYTVIVWTDYRSGNADIYAQRIENNTGLATWLPIDGTPVCVADGAQTNPRAAYDSLGGVIITWEDERNVGSGGHKEIYAQRLHFTTGAKDIAWAYSYPSGVPICTGQAGDAVRPRILGTGEGAFISWTDYRNAVAGQNTDVYLQCILSSTASYPSGNWVNNGIRVSVDSTNNQQHQELASDNYWQTDAGRRTRTGVVIVYEDDRNISPWYQHHVWNIYADAFKRDGSRSWGDLGMAPDSVNEENPQILRRALYN
jgi:hypothetical protein